MIRSAHSGDEKSVDAVPRAVVLCRSMNQTTFAALTGTGPARPSSAHRGRSYAWGLVMATDVLVPTAGAKGTICTKDASTNPATARHLGMPPT